MFLGSTNKRPQRRQPLQIGKRTHRKNVFWQTTSPDCVVHALSGQHIFGTSNYHAFDTRSVGGGIHPIYLISGHRQLRTHASYRDLPYQSAGESPTPSPIFHLNFSDTILYPISSCASLRCTPVIQFEFSRFGFGGSPDPVVRLLCLGLPPPDGEDEGLIFTYIAVALIVIPSIVRTSKWRL